MSHCPSQDWDRYYADEERAAEDAAIYADAMRYRWLRDRAWDKPELLATHGDWCVFTSERLDDAIDQAMERDAPQ